MGFLLVRGKETRFPCNVPLVQCILFCNLCLMGLAHTIIKVYLATIYSCHVEFGNRPVFRDPIVEHFLQRARRQQQPLAHVNWGLLQRSRAWCQTPVNTQSSFTFINTDTVLNNLTSYYLLVQQVGCSKAHNHGSFASFNRAADLTLP